MQDATGPHFRFTRTSGSTTGQLGAIDFGNADVDIQLASIVATQDGTTSDARLSFQTEGTGDSLKERIRIDSIGDVIFYDDDGTTPGMRWDASTD